MTAADVEEEHSELDDYFHGFHAAKQSIALTREFFDQRHEYLLETINSPRGSPKKRVKSNKKKKKKDKHRNKHKHKHKKDRKKEKHNKPIRDEVSKDNSYYAPLEIKEKGWRKHQTIATSAAIANQYETVAPKPSHKNENKQKAQHVTNQYKNYVNYHSDSDDFGVFDIADFAKQIQKQPNKHSISNHSDKKKSKQQRKRDKKQKKKEKKRLEKERKRKENHKKELKFTYKAKYRKNGTDPKPSLITNGNTDKNGVRLNSSQTSPATAAAFTFETIPHIIPPKTIHKIPPKTVPKIISPSAIPNIPPDLSSPPSQPPLCHNIDSSDSSSSSSSSDGSDINLDDVVISEMAPSPSSVPLDSFADTVKSTSQVNLRKYGNDKRAIDGEGANHVKVPSMALSLLDSVEYETSANVNKSPFFDPAFWNNDFEKRKQDRKRHFTQNLSRIDQLDYSGLNVLDEDQENDIESDMSRQQTVAHHAKTMTKMKLKRFAKKEMFLDDIGKVFDPKYNKKWIKALNGKDDAHVLHLVDDHSGHQRKSTMAHWEHFDNFSIKNGTDHLSLVPKLIYFSKAFFESKESVFIFRLVKQGIETLVSSSEDKVKMMSQLHLAFEREFDTTSYVAPKYSELQILEKQIVWVGAVKDKLKDNPFLSSEAFDSIEARNDYLNEFKSQLDEESMELFNQHSSLSKEEQVRASIALKKDSINEASNNTKKKRLFGWFRKKENKNNNKKRDEEKNDNKYISYRTRGDTSYTDYNYTETTMDYYSLYFILLCLLLRHYNNGRNFLVFTISCSAIRMTELGDKILDIFGIMTKCGNIYRILCYLKICTKVLSTEASYFDDVLQRLADIREYLDDDHNKLMTLREKLHLKKVIMRMSNWCKLCITRYQHIFFGATGPRALKSCLRCWKFCFSMLYKLNNLDFECDEFERKWCWKVKEIIKKSVFDYEFPRLVELYRENAGNGSGPCFFFSRETYNKQYQQFNKMKMKMKMDSMDSSNSSSVYMDSPVEDATQLIMVIKGCRKYLVLDEEEYESAFKSCCTAKHFSLLKIASSQYMTLAFSFTNLYLRVLAFGIQEKIEERRLNLEFAAKNCKKRKTKGNDDDNNDAKLNEMNKLLENTDFEVDPSVWALYQELKRFYDDLKRIYKSLRKNKIHATLPEVHYAGHYNDIIAYWCQYQGIKFTNPYNGYVTKLTSSETWKKISQNALYSTSVIDLFTLIDPLQHWFLNLPYTNENLLNFARLLTSIVQAYVNTLHEKITKYLLKELEKKELAFYSKKKEEKMVVWNFPMKLMIAINDIIMAKTQLQQTISKLMLDRRYTSVNDDNKVSIGKRSIGKSSHASLARYHTLKQTMLLPPELDLNATHIAVGSQDTVTTFYKHKILPSEFNYNYFDEEDDIRIWNKLNCVEAFQTINKSLSSISFLVGQGLNSDISHEVFLLLWENETFPPSMPLKKEKVEDELMDMLWKKLCTKCDLLHENISPLFTPYILADFFSLICSDFIKLLIPKREKYVLNLNQLTRVEFAIAEIQNFLLDCYNIEHVLIHQNENLYRLKHILNLQLSGSNILMNLHRELSKDEDWANQYQLENEPFVGPKALWLIIKHRSKHHKQDQQLLKYYEEHSGIKAQLKSFTKAVRSRWG